MSNETVAGMYSIISEMALNLRYPPVVTYISTEEAIMPEKKQSLEWITTKQAMKILRVNSTQAVRYLMDKHPDKFTSINMGSEKQPRWLLLKADVIRFQNERTADG